MPKMSVVGMEAEGPEILIFDMSEKEVKALKIGQKIDIMVSGEVGMLNVPPDPKSDASPELGIRVKKKKLVGKTEIDELMDDSED